MVVKRILLSEHNLVIALFNKYRVFYKQAPDLALAEAYIKARIENNESVIFVALADIDGIQVPAGFTQLYPRLSSVRATKNWLLNDLYVDAAFRRQGIGEALIKTAMEFARNEGATYITLDTAIDNYTAQSLYETIGFIRQVPGGSFFTYQAQL